MKKILIATIFSLAPFLTHAATESLHGKGNLVRTESISVSGGTIDDLTRKISAKAEMRGAEAYKITYLNVDNRGYAFAVLFNKSNES